MRDEAMETSADDIQHSSAKTRRVLGELDEDSIRRQGTPPSVDFFSARVLHSEGVRVRGSTVEKMHIASSEGRIIRLKPDVVSYYRTPGVFKFRRRVSTNSPPSNPFNKYEVPDEILIHIFKNLNKKDLTAAMRTCKKFYFAGCSSELWEHGVDISGLSLTSIALNCLLARGVRVLRSNTSVIHFSRLHDSPFGLDASTCRLTHLDLGSTSFPSPSHLNAVLSKCISLQCLSMENLTLSTEVFVSIGGNSSLTQLCLSMCKGVTERGLRLLFTGCKRIEQLNLSCCGLGAAETAAVCTLAPRSLLKLNLAGTNVGAMQDLNVDDLVICCPQLNEVDLSDSTEITAEAYRTLVEGLPRLRVLSLCRCYNIDPTIFLETGHLRVLNIFNNVTDAGLNTLRLRLPPHLVLNESALSNIARPTVPPQVTSIWEQRTRDLY